MAGLLRRLASGLAEGAVAIGQSGLEEKRQQRLMAIKDKQAAAQREFQTSEREARQAYQTSEREAGEQFRLATATPKGAKVDEVKSIIKDEPALGEMESSGGYTTVYKSGRKTYYDPKTDTETELGKGTPAVDAGDLDADAAAYAEAKADAMAGYFSSDATDFADQGGTRELALQAFEQEYRDAHKAGDVSKLYKSKGKELKETTVKPAAATGQSMVDKILKDFEGKADEREILQAIVNDPRMSEQDKTDAQQRLKQLGL